VLFTIDIIAIPRADIFSFTARHQFIRRFQEVGGSERRDDPLVTHEVLRDHTDVVASIVRTKTSKSRYD